MFYKSQCLLNNFLIFLIIGIVTYLSTFPAGAEEDIIPLSRAHSHNDYIREKPLFDALNAGFCSVEADVHLVEGDLLVCHDLENCKPEKNLKSMYLIPLFEQVEKNNGYVFRVPTDFYLLIDIKNNPEETYSLLKEYLKPYEKYLTKVVERNLIKGGVTIVISGSVPRETITKENTRLVFIDGRLNDLESNPPNTLVPWVSASWLSVFSWLGVGEIPSEEIKKLRELVKKAHEQGRKLRFWSAPQTETAWEILYSEGVDLINTDFPSKLSSFLRNKTK
ncbi:MAG: phosphatidylinositol-specific phospholipase C/glycerophosphodiester phosphodiesterase family protein [Candidatus Hydrogenedentes bacterium]|nr:phosphatidylinositol-specific phospholipase C/glycerophosphodiester phosphodiesterase family protein [Candidatus Hydrogenedentota bacterium]